MGGRWTIGPLPSRLLIQAAVILASFVLPWALQQHVCSLDQGRLLCRKDAKSPAVCISMVCAQLISLNTFKKVMCFSGFLRMRGERSE